MPKCFHCKRQIGRFSSCWTEDNVISYTCWRCRLWVPLGVTGIIISIIISIILYSRYVSHQ